MSRLDKLFAKVRSSDSYKAEAARAALAADLKIMIAQSGHTQADIAAKLKISAPTLCRKLSGSSNLTIDSIGEIARAAGMEFDVVFREAGARCAMQPWTRKVVRQREIEDLGRQVQEAMQAIESVKAAIRQAHRPNSFEPADFFAFAPKARKEASNQASYDQLAQAA